MPVSGLVSSLLSSRLEEKQSTADHQQGGRGSLSLPILTAQRLHPLIFPQTFPPPTLPFHLVILKITLSREEEYLVTCDAAKLDRIISNLM